MFSLLAALITLHVLHFAIVALGWFRGTWINNPVGSWNKRIFRFLRSCHVLSILDSLSFVFIICTYLKQQKKRSLFRSKIVDHQ